VSERRKQLEAIFHAASELGTPGERERYLEAVCQGDANLKREVWSLLDAAVAGEELLRPIESPASGCVEVPLPPIIEQTRTRIGRYKLLEKIGEGGMGVVHMAEQEEPVRRKVALKFLKLGLDTRQHVARFDAERQALAMMDHPHIARVLDGGTTETGRPFFVMELVQGVPITRFCETNELSIEERLNLFIPVCQAIQSAHQKGIIHRDIKPSNVLVTMHNGAPHPMVIDFGVAKAIDQKLTEKTLFTNFATMIGTPAYMSPEQAEMSKLDVDTRSDIYSLGVLLYELLTGTTPFPEERLRSVAYGEMQRIIVEEEPERPSTRLKKKLLSFPEIRNLKSGIDPDLDWIVMKCLEKDRNRRYETATGLAADLRRHLNNEPVAACPPSATYRLQKFARRNKLKFAAASVALAAVIGGLLVSTWQAMRATRAESDALAVKEFLVEQLLAANLFMETANDPNRRQLLQRVVQAAGTRFVNRPLIEAEVRMAVGEAFHGIDEGDSAALEQFQKALAIRRRLLGPTHSDTLFAIGCAAIAHFQLGQWNEAEKVLAEGLVYMDVKGQPRSIGEAEVFQAHAGVLRRMGHTEEAISYYDQATAAAGRLADHKSWRYQTKLGWQIAANLQAGRTNEADTLSIAALRQAQDHFGNYHPVTAIFYGRRADVFNRIGRHLDAAKIFEEDVLPVYRRSFGTNHLRTVQAEFGLARSLELGGEAERALNNYSNLQERTVAKLPLYSARNELHIMGLFFTKQRRLDLAQAVRDRLCKSYEINPPGNVADFETFLHTIVTTRDWPAAAGLCRQYFDLFPNGPELCRDLAKSFINERRHDEAKALYECLRKSFSGRDPMRPQEKDLLDALMKTLEAGL
jgi:tetratricopeptide (TPR) repeat protein